MRFLLQPPSTYNSNQAFALWVVLHGACATAEQATTMFGREAAERNAFLLAPEASRPCGDGYCWSFADDAKAIQEIITVVQATYTIDRTRLSLIGYSMGCVMGLWLIAQNPRQFAFFAALCMGSAFEPWEYDDGGIDQQGLGASGGTTRVLLAVDQLDPAGTNNYFEDNLARLCAANLEVDTFRPREGTHNVTDSMKTAILRALP